jgi:DNA-binding NarL/FixJ family response regulator
MPVNDDPSVRRRRDKEAKHRRDQQIIKLKNKGKTVREIAALLGLPPKSD